MFSLVEILVMIFLSLMFLCISTIRYIEKYYTANESQDRLNRNNVLYGILPYSQKLPNQVSFVENFSINDKSSRLIFPEGGAKWIPCWECEQEIYAVEEQGC
jgi:hypothetical protein